MAQSSGFFNSEMINGKPDRLYLAEQFAKFFAMFIGNGIFIQNSNALKVVENIQTNMSVLIRSGDAFINGYWFKNDDDNVINIGVADGILNRKDLIVIRWDISTRSCYFDIKKGVPANQAVRPMLTRNNSVYELGLAEINISAGTVSITNANITDLRQDKNYCGVVKGLIEQIDMSEVFSQYQAIFTQMNTSQRNEFQIWFDDLKGKLDGDIATQLQLQIDKLNEDIDILSKTDVMPKNIYDQRISDVTSGDLLNTKEGRAQIYQIWGKTELVGEPSIDNPAQLRYIGQNGDIINLYAMSKNHIPRNVEFNEDTYDMYTAYNPTYGCLTISGYATQDLQLQFINTIKYEPNKVYTLSLFEDLPQGVSVYLYSFENGKILEVDTNNKIATGILSTNGSITIWAYLFIKEDVSIPSEIRLKVQLEVGDKQTSFVPHSVNKMDLALGDTYGMPDYPHLLSTPDGTVDYILGYRNINGTSNMMKQVNIIRLDQVSKSISMVGGTAFYSMFRIVINASGSLTSSLRPIEVSRQSVYCNMFPEIKFSSESAYLKEGIYVGTKSGVTTTANAFYITIRNDRLTTSNVTGFNEWLASNYVYICYKCYLGTQKQVKLDYLSTYDGGTVFYIKPQYRALSGLQADFIVGNNHSNYEINSGMASTGSQTTNGVMRNVLRTNAHICTPNEMAAVYSYVLGMVGRMASSSSALSTAQFNTIFPRPHTIALASGTGQSVVYISQFDIEYVQEVISTGYRSAFTIYVNRVYQQGSYGQCIGLVQFSYPHKGHDVSVT